MTVPGTSPKTTKPKSAAQTMPVYWNGTTTAAGARRSDRFTHICATVAARPSDPSSRKSTGPGATQANGALTEPASITPSVCPEIGSESCRERVCQYVWISVVAVPLKKNNAESKLQNNHILQ